MATVLEEDMMIHGGLKFQKSSDGVKVTIHDGVAENAPVAREVFLSAEEWQDVLDDVGTSEEVPEVLIPDTKTSRAEASKSLVDDLTKVVDDAVPEE